MSWCTAWMSTLPFPYWCLWDSCFTMWNWMEGFPEHQCLGAKAGCGGRVERLLCYAEE